MPVQMEGHLYIGIPGEKVESVKKIIMIIMLILWKTREFFSVVSLRRQMKY